MLIRLHPSVVTTALAALLFAAGFVLWRPVAGAASEALNWLASPPEILNHRVLVVPVTTTALFRWDEQSIGLLDSTASVVSRVSASDPSAREDLQLDAGLGSGGQVMADQIVRDERSRFYWLSRAQQQVGVFSADGRVEYTVMPEGASLTSMTLTDDRLEVTGTRDGDAVTHVYDRNGAFVGTRSIAHAGDPAHDQRRFSFPQVGAMPEVEILIYQPALVIGQTRRSYANYLAASLLHSSPAAAVPQTPLILAATRGSDGYVWLLTNGGRVISISPSGAMRGIPLATLRETGELFLDVVSVGPVIGVLGRSKAATRLHLIQISKDPQQ
jgi:hypothetical protein